MKINKEQMRKIGAKSGVVIGAAAGVIGIVKMIQNKNKKGTN